MMRTIATTMLGLALLAAGPQASAFGFGMRHGGGPGFAGSPMGPGGGPGGMPLRILVSRLTPEQRQQVRQILVNNRTEIRSIADQLHQAHEALGDKMFASGALTDADVAPFVQKIATLHQKLLENGTKVMLQVRAVATPEQLADAAQAKAKLAKMHEDMRSLVGDSFEDEAPGPE
jgi:Spy/CpxP family protein refolding chaperone